MQLPAPADSPPDGHILWVATEGGNVLMHPLQRHYLVHKSQVRRILVVLTVLQVREMQEAEEADSVCDGNKDDIRIFLYEVGAIILRVSRSAYIESATINPHDDRFLLGFSSG